MFESPDLSIKKHLDHYLSLLSSGQEISLTDLTANFINLRPILHQLADSPGLDLNALSYCLPRLPDNIFSVTKILLVQSYDDIKSIGFDITRWQRVTAPSRRRLIYQNPGGNTLACLLSSDSDIHDLVNCLISFYLEKEKIRKLLAGRHNDFIQREAYSFLRLDQNQWARLKSLLGRNWDNKIMTTVGNVVPILKMYGRVPPLYPKNCQAWITNLSHQSLVVGLKDSPIYFVSSDSHSLVNIIGGFINQKQNYIFDYITTADSQLYNQWFEIKKKNNTSRINDFLYSVAGKFLKDNPEFVAQKRNHEASLGIKTVTSTDAFQSNSQIIPLTAIAQSTNLDPNLTLSHRSLFAKSDAYILNIEYPLGVAAYYLLKQILATFLSLRAVHILGKAAILAGSVGDIQIPTFVYDELTDNRFLFDNVFNHQEIFQTFISNVYPDQKAVSVYGTFLENLTLTQKYLAGGINIIEMESGPYLQALTETYLLGGHHIPEHHQFTLANLPIDFGVINYASDNPLIKTLAEEADSFRGIEPVYLASLASLQRIINLEEGRMLSL
jgi:hypothetical protein